MATIQEILDETTNFINTKQASYADKAALAGEDPGSMPGAEHDGPVPEEHKTPDPEVDDGTNGPVGSHKNTIASGSDDSPVTRGHVVDAETAVDSATEKPLVTSDANAKTAADLCNDLLSDIEAYRAQPEKVAEPVEAPAEPTPTEPEPADKVAEEVTDVVDEDIPVKKEPEVDTAPEKKAEPTGGLNLDLTAEFLQKIGAILLSTEEGTQLVEAQLNKHAGEQKAEQLMGFIVEQSEEAEKAAAAAQGVADANAYIEQMQYEAGYKQAQAEFLAANPELATPAEPTAKVQACATKLAQEIADASIEDLMGGMGGGAEPGMDVPPEAIEGAPEAGAPEAGLPPEAGMDEEEFTEEDVMAALELLVQQGTLDPQDAQAILDQVAGGGAEAAPAAEAPVEEPGAEAPPPEAEPTEPGGVAAE